jgi:hypothetical protein
MGSWDIEHLKHPEEGLATRGLATRELPTQQAGRPADRWRQRFRESGPMAPTVPLQRADGANGSLRTAMNRC